MKVVVTGASGFIGRSVVGRLVRESLDIRAVSYRHVDRLPIDGVQHIIGDLREEEFADRITEGADTVIHLAGLAHVRASADDHKELNEKATARLAKASAHNGVHRFLFASSVSVYGDYRDELVKEEALCRPVTEYGKSKLRAEEALAALADGYPMSTTILRLSTAYGVDDPGNMSRLIKSVRRFGPIVMGNGSNLKSLTYVSNIADLILSLLKMRPLGLDVVNVGDPTPYSLCSIVRTIVDVTGDRRPLVKVPLSMAMTGAGLLEMGFGAIGRTPPVSREQVKKLTETVALDVTKLRDKYRFTSPVTLREGIRRTIGMV